MEKVLLDAVIYVVVVVVCGVIAVSLLNWHLPEWDDVMVAELKTFALTALLVMLSYYGYSLIK
jgi:hypothetical protein